MRALLAAGANVTIESGGSTALDIARLRQHDEIVKILTEAEGKEKSTARETLLEALEPNARKRGEIAKRLDKSDKKIQEAREQIAHMKALEKNDLLAKATAGRAAEVEAVLDRGVVDNNGVTVLMKASYGGSLQTVRVLVAPGGQCEYTK